MRKIWILAVLLAASLALFTGAGLLQSQQGASNLGPVINSPDSDFGPIIAADGNKLFFTSDRAGGMGGQDVWVSERGPNGQWGPPKNLGNQVNTKYNEGPDSVTVNNKTIYFTRCDRIGDPGTCDIYSADLDESMGAWTGVQNLGTNVNSKFNDANASISFDGKTLYFVSDRPVKEYKGRNWNIYRSRYEGGRWTEAEMLGAPINTPGAEIHVMIHQDNETFFFSTDGLGGFGGADIFMSKIGPDGSFSQPQNLGPQVNTPENDMYFTMPAAGDLAYLASNRPTTECRTDCAEGDPACSCMEDIYAVPIALTVKGVIIVKGIVADRKTCGPATTDPVTGMPIYDIKTCTPIDKALIRLADVITDQPVKEDLTGPTGAYQVAIPAGKDYSITAKAPGYSFHSERFNVSEKQSYQIIEKNVLLDPLGIGTTIILNNIYFDFDKATLRPESKNGLQVAINFLLENPNVKVEIGGHTDSKGSDKYNIKLSLARAKSVYDYMVRIGNINPARLSYYGYGERMPIASNATDEGRQLNRRVEFKIIAMQ